LWIKITTASKFRAPFPKLIKNQLRIIHIIGSTGICQTILHYVFKTIMLEGRVK